MAERAVAQLPKTVQTSKGTLVNSSFSFYQNSLVWIFYLLISSAFICPYGLHCCPKTRRARSMCCCCCCCCCRCRRNWRLSVVWGLLVLVGVAVAFLMVVLVFIALRWILVLVLSSAAYWHLVPGRQAQALVLQSAVQGASEGCDGRADSRSWIFSLRPALLICLR